MIVGNLRHGTVIPLEIGAVSEACRDISREFTVVQTV